MSDRRMSTDYSLIALKQDVSISAFHIRQDCSRPDRSSERTGNGIIFGQVRRARGRTRSRASPCSGGRIVGSMSSQSAMCSTQRLIMKGGKGGYIYQPSSTSPAVHLARHLIHPLHFTHAQHATRNHGFRRFQTRNSRPDPHRCSRQVRREAFSRIPGPGLPPGRR